MTSRVPGYPWKLTGAPNGAAVTAATGWFTEAACMTRNERHFVWITSCSFLQAFWCTTCAATEDRFPCFSPWSSVVCRVMFRMIRGGCSVFGSFCCYLVVRWCIWPVQEIISIPLMRNVLGKEQFTLVNTTTEYMTSRKITRLWTKLNLHFEKRISRCELHADFNLWLKTQAYKYISNCKLLYNHDFKSNKLIFYSTFIRGI